MTNEVTHYDFDGAVITCLKVFGASPINKVFLAEYLGGMTVTDIERRVQVPPEDMGQRLLPNNVDVEGAFWDTFDRCYMIQPTRYAEICMFYHSYLITNMGSDKSQIIVKSSVLRDALHQDCKFFFPSEYQAVNRDRFAEMEQPGQEHTIFRIVKEYLEMNASNRIGVPWRTTHMRPYDLQLRLKVPENEILLSAIVRCILELPKTQGSPWLIQICQKESNGQLTYNHWKDSLETVSGRSIDETAYNGRNGKALVYAQIIGSGPTDHLLFTYKILVFYSNMFNWFSTFVVKYIEDRRYRTSNSVALQHTLPENYPHTDKSTPAIFSVNTIKNFHTVLHNIQAFDVFKQAFSAEQIRNMRVERIRQEAQFRQARVQKVGSRFFSS